MSAKVVIKIPITPLVGMTVRVKTKWEFLHEFDLSEQEFEEGFECGDYLFTPEMAGSCGSYAKIISVDIEDNSFRLDCDERFWFDKQMVIFLDDMNAEIDQGFGFRVGERVEFKSFAELESEGIDPDDIWMVGPIFDLCGREFTITRFEPYDSRMSRVFFEDRELEMWHLNTAMFKHIVELPSPNADRWEEVLTGGD